MLGISLLTSFFLALRVVLVAKLVISGILSSISLILGLHTSFLTTSFFTNSAGTSTNLSASNLFCNYFLIFIYLIYLLSTLLSKLLKLFGTSFNLSISNLSTSDE